MSNMSWVMTVILTFALNYIYYADFIPNSFTIYLTLLKYLTESQYIILYYNQ